MKNKEREERTVRQPSITLANSAAIGGSLAGGAGSDTLSYAGFGSAVTVTVSATGSDTGFNGSANGITGGFTDVNVLTGSSNTDSLVGLDVAANWEVDGSNRYYVGSNELAFSAVENLTGGSDVDTFTLTADHSGVLSGNGGADVFSLSSDADLTGSIDAGVGADAVTVSATASVSGNVDLGANDDSITLAGSASVGAVIGAAGTDTLSYAGYGSAASIALSAAGGTDGYDGTGSGITGTFTDVNVLTGSSNSDTLTGLDAVATWGIDGSNDYTSGGRSIAFSAVENLTGGSAVDTFNVSADHTGTLTGNGAADVFSLSAAAALTGGISAGAGNDSITLAGTSSVSGTIAGGADTDTLSFAGSTAGRTITLSALGGTDGFDGSATSVGGFSDVNVLTGSSNTDTLVGRAVDATWEIDGSNRYLNGATELAFSAVENLTGGSAIDTFTLTADHTGDLAGSAGADVFNLSSDADLTGGISGGDDSDSVTVSNTASVSGAVDGGNAGDTVSLSNTASVGSISGGAGNDNFALAGSATVGGAVSGGAGSDSLSYSGYSSALTVTLSGAAVADGYLGFATGLGAGFTTIDALTGSSGSDTLKGSHVASTWTLDASSSYSDGAANTLGFAGFETLSGGAAADSFVVMNNTTLSGVSIDGGIGANSVSYADASNTSAVAVSISGTNAGSVAGSFSFASIASLVGSSANDTFTFTANSARLTGSVNGGGGTNTLSYSGYTSGVRVNLAAGSATGTAGVTSIQNVTGGSGNDLLMGSNADNTLSGGSGNDSLVGGGGADTLAGDAGNDVLIGGAGVDALTGGADDDILIGGSTNYDANISALNAIMAEWGRTSVAYSTRVSRILGTASGGLNGSFRFNDTTVSDDASAVDTLTGGAGLDWFIVTGDTIADLNTGGSETQTNVS